MRKRMIIMIAALALVLGGVFGFKGFQSYMLGQMMAEKEPPPATVAAVKPERSTWQRSLELTGQLRAAQQVAVTTERAGIVRDITFDSGTTVSEGELLVALDIRTDEAELAALEADARLAEITMERERELRQQDLNSQADLDRAEAEYDRARAEVEAQAARIAEKTIRAPFSGQLGIRRVDLGEFVNPGAEIVSLQKLDPIFVDFDIPQKRIADVSVGDPISLSAAGYDQAFAGRVASLSPELQRDSRTFTARARLSNPEGRLRPGMYGNVRLDIGEPEPFVTIRQSAVSYNPFGDSVWVVSREGDGEEAPLVAQRRSVQTGRTRGDQVQILEGVATEDRVVVAGHHKLRPGARVKIDNSNLPPNEAAPEDLENR